MYFLTAFVSDAIQHRAAFGIFGALASMAGHVMLIAGHGVAVPYLGCFFIATGLFIVSGGCRRICHGTGRGARRWGCN